MQANDPKRWTWTLAAWLALPLLACGSDSEAPPTVEETFESCDLQPLCAWEVSPLQNAESPQVIENNICVYEALRDRKRGWVEWGFEIAGTPDPTLFRVFIGAEGSGLRWTVLPRYDNSVAEVSLAASEWFDACVTQLEQGALYTDCDDGWQWFAEVGPETEPYCLEP